MATLDCSHEGATGDFRVCAHLLENESLIDYIQYFTGVGKTYHLICRACAEQRGALEAALRPVGESCFRTIEEKRCWVDTVGRPEVRFEPAALVFEHREVVFSELVGADRVRAVQPLPQGNGSVWIGVTVAGALWRIDCDRPAVELVTRLLPEELDPARAIELVLSPDGRWAAVYNMLGLRGVVVDLESGRHAMQLRREDYYANISPFSAVFWLHQGRVLLIHGTEWNRVDISDPATGALLTVREPGPYPQGGPAPEHYLDYFHGRLTVSPDHGWIADDGWVWHPSGRVTSWDLSRWLEDNVWESEDGPSKHYMGTTALWNIPMAWKGERTLMVWGHGPDEDKVIPAVQFWDVVSGTLLDWFPGPEGEFVFDRYLFSILMGRGSITVWDVERGVGLLKDASFAPAAYHRGTREFLTLRPEGRFQLSRLVERG